MIERIADPSAAAERETPTTGAGTRRAFIERLATTSALPVILPILLSPPFPARADY